MSDIGQYYIEFKYGNDTAFKKYIVNIICMTNFCKEMYIYGIY